MKLLPGVAGLYRGSSFASGMKTKLEPPSESVVILSRPWAKNWPKNVKKLLNGAERPLSGVTLGMKRLWGRPRPVWLLAEAFIGVARLPNVVGAGPSAQVTGGPVSSAVPYMP